MYVDDVLAGGHTIEEAVVSKNQLSGALASAGFDLRKWSSNHPTIINDLPPDSLLYDDCLHLSENLLRRHLVLSGTLVVIRFHSRKREVLSIIARFFDPCGWLAPIIVVVKLIMQQRYMDSVILLKRYTPRLYMFDLKIIMTYTHIFWLRKHVLHRSRKSLCLGWNYVELFY